MIIYHPLLVSVFPILFFYAHNQSQLHPQIIIAPIIISLGLTLILWTLITLVFKSISKSALFVSIFVFAFFSYGHLSSALKNIFIPIRPGFVIGPDKILFPLLTLSFALLFIFLRRTHRPTRHLNVTLNITFSLILLAQILTVSYQEFLLSKRTNLHPITQTTKVTTSTSPDIYYIILDAYARADVLETIYGFDNSAFTDHLSDLGFSLATDSTSNYNHTHLSLPSSLNFRYLDPQEDQDLEDLVHHSQIVSFLKDQGYAIINFSSGWGPTDKLASADINYDQGKIFSLLGQTLPLNEFYLVFLQTTGLSPFIRDTLADQARAKVLYALDKLTEIPYRRGPKFVLAHFNIPHPPYLFDENGQPIPSQVLELAGESFSDRTNYLKQLRFITDRITSTIDNVISRSSTPPIIILQSDHGPASILGHPTRWPHPAPAPGIRERMSILNAYYFPGRNPAVYSTITPVNSFRLLLNSYFNQSLELLPDKNYFYDYQLPGQYPDVTSVVASHP